MRRGDLLNRLESGALRNRLETVYGPDADAAALRLRDLVLEYAGIFPCGADTETLLFSTPGRTELGGNHTDHQRGHALAASVNLDTIACVSPNGSRTIRIKSRSHRMAEVDLDDLSVHPEETGSSPSLVRGVAARLTELGFPIGGFDAYTTTRVLRGSGLSSSAAFEVLVCTIMFCGGALSPIQLAQAGQYAENVYFGKPCGLLDQMACASGGVVAADFADPAAPAARQVRVDLAGLGYALCIVAAFFGQEVLGQVTEEQLLAQLDAVRSACGDRAVLRALHFFRDDRRVLRQREALEAGDFAAFLHCVRQSGRSSFMYLQNVSNYRDSRVQPVAVLLAAAEGLLEGEGACRVHGGGFAGTIQAFVPLEKLDRFVSGMEAAAGAGNCHVLTIRGAGSVLLVD